MRTCSCPTNTSRRSRYLGELFQWSRVKTSRCSSCGRGRSDEYQGKAFQVVTMARLKAQYVVSEDGEGDDYGEYEG